MPKLYFSRQFRLGSVGIWHQRLEHSQFSTLKLLQNKALNDIIKTIKHERVCYHCQFMKLNKLPFSYYEHSSSLIEKFKYYTCWIIPLQHKSDFANAYLAFKHYVSRQFNKQIMVFHSDGGESITPNYHHTSSEEVWFIKYHAFILHNKQV